MKSEDIKKKIFELKMELFRARSQISAGSVPDNPGKVKEIRRTIARLNTVLRERNEE